MNTLADRLKAAGSAHSRQITNELTTELALMEALLPKYLSSIFLPRKQWFEGLPEATRKHL